jgi:hypothetical protein
VRLLSLSSAPTDSAAGRPGGTCGASDVRRVPYTRAEMITQATRNTTICSQVGQGSRWTPLAVRLSSTKYTSQAPQPLAFDSGASVT